MCTAQDGREAKNNDTLRATRKMERHWKTAYCFKKQLVIDSNTDTLHNLWPILSGPILMPAIIGPTEKSEDSFEEGFE